MPTPAPPKGFVVDGPARPIDPLLRAGVGPTSGFRTPADIQRLRAAGYSPASNSLHLRGDAVDLVPGRSGLSMRELRDRALSVAASWPGGRALNEGDHIHLQLPGWGRAPGTPGTSDAGMPDLPPGFSLEQRGSLRPGGYTPRAIPGRLAPTGQVHDGDTFRVATGENARLYGVDAFEIDQRGQRSDRSYAPLGVQSRDALRQFALPGALAITTGARTYGRPVALLSSNGQDAAKALLDQGLALAAPQYLKGSPLLPQYMEAERLARANRRGAHAMTYATPEAARHGEHDPWLHAEESKGGTGRAVFWDEPTPFDGLRKDVAAGWLALHNDPKSTAADFEAYAKANGFDFDRGENARFLKERAAHPERKINQGITYTQARRVLTDPGDGTAGALARGFADPINMIDEMGAVADALGATGGRENVWNSDRRFGDIFANNLEQNRSILGHDDAYHPWARFGGQLTSGLLLPGAGVEGASARATAKALEAGASEWAARQAAIKAMTGRVATAGSIEGGLAGFGSGEDLRSRIGRGALGAGAGALGGAAIGRAGQAVAESGMVRRLAGRLAPRREAAGTLDGMPVDGRPSQPVAANMAADDLPVRIGPDLRERDYLDLPPLPPGYQLTDPVGGVQPFGQRLDPATMARLFEGTDPQALLPRPGNVVASLEEATAANPGSFARVTAPNELDSLAIRKLPSPTDLYKSRSVRGPLDMTQALRRLGGVQDEGGELSHLGIDNAPRRLPFGGSEAFHGRLINNDGMPLDEATHRLWEMGYFPEFAERPTPADLIDRLHQESTGANRFFRPEDAAEVADYEAALNSRHALEAREAESGPIFERRGSEVSLDDLAANQPPASAYEDAPRLTGKVGNINLDHIEKPEDVAQILDHVAKRVGGFDAASRGRVTNEETARLAAEMGLTPEQLLRRQQGQALNAEQAFAARNLLRGSLEQVGKLARKAMGGSDADKLALERALLKHTAIHEQVAGATSEAGRALQQFKMASAVERQQAKAIREYLKGAKGDSLDDTAAAIIDLMEDPAKANRFIQQVTKPRFRDKVVELYYNSLLSGPKTHAVNIISNFVTALGSLPEHAAASALGGLRALGGKALGRDAGERIFASEIGARAVGLLQGAVDGLRAARYTFKTGNVPDLMSKVEAAQHEAIGGRLGHVLRTPTRALAAEDEFFKAIARRSELASLATRKARQEGLDGAAFKARVAELTDNPPDEMLAQALDFARYQTFQRPVGDIAGGVMRAANAHPLLKLVVPFVRTPTNIVKYAAERSPAAPLLKEWRADMVAGGPRRDLALARMTLGTGLGLYIAHLAGEGLITGGGPLDENARGIMRADGWQPYSIKVGDKWVSYQRLDPLAMTLGIAADYVEKQSRMTDRQRDQQAMLMVASIIQNLSDKTWLSGLSETLGALQDPVRYGPNALRRTVAGVAVPAAASQVASSLDQSPRETKSVGEAVQARIPGLSDNLRPSLDVWGRPITREGSAGPDILSPFTVSKAKHDPVAKEALAINLRLGEPSRTVGGRRLDDAQFHQYRRMAGEMTYSELRDAIATPEWTKLSIEQRRKRADAIKLKARKDARSALFTSQGERPLPGALALPVERPVPPSLPPLPPGFELER